MKMTRHNGRAGKNGVYNPKHNDRQFDLTNADHIDAVRERQNIYWDCFQGFRTGMDDGQAHDSFEDVERQFYSLFYRESVEAQNERNIQNRHPERNRSTDDLLHDKRTCPEESILQIGNIDESVDGETLVKIACAFFAEMEERYGEHTMARRMILWNGASGICWAAPSRWAAKTPTAFSPGTAAWHPRRCSPT